MCRQISVLFVPTWWAEWFQAVWGFLAFPCILWDHWKQGMARMWKQLTRVNNKNNPSHVQIYPNRGLGTVCEDLQNVTNRRGRWRRKSRRRRFPIFFQIQHTSASCIISSGGVPVPLLQCPVQARVRICNLFRVPAITCLLFVKDTVGSLTSTISCWQIGSLGSPHTHWWITLAVKHSDDSFVDGSRFHPRFDRSEEGVRTSRPSCQPQQRLDFWRVKPCFEHF